MNDSSSVLCASAVIWFWLWVFTVKNSEVNHSSHSCCGIITQSNYCQALLGFLRTKDVDILLTGRHMVWTARLEPRCSALSAAALLSPQCSF